MSPLFVNFQEIGIAALLYEAGHGLIHYIVAGPTLQCHPLLVAALLPRWQAQSMPPHAVWNYLLLAVTKGFSILQQVWRAPW